MSSCACSKERISRSGRPDNGAFFKMTRFAAAAFALALTCPATVVGQQDSASVRLMFSHHDAAPPDYLAALAITELAAVRVPAPPIISPGLAALHHDRAMASYPVADAHGPPVPIPAPPPGRPPVAVRGLYLNAWVFGSSRFYDLLALADTTEINAFVIDVKDATGYVAYRSSVPTAVSIEANDLIRVRNAQSRLAQLRAHGVHPIARIVVARDRLLAARKPQWAIKDRRGGLWIDGLGYPWVDAYHDSVWIYAADIAAEAIVMGFGEVQFDYIRFPDEPPERLAHAIFAARRDGESRRAAVQRHVRRMRERLQPLGVPFTLDVFGMTTSSNDDLGIGQNWDDLVRLADVLLPMVYPSHYPRGAYGIRYPNADPYRIVRRALEPAIQRSAGIPGAARIRPYLQAFTLRRPRYNATEVRAQIRAVEDLGLTDWVLWNARGVYPPGALRAGSESVIAPDPLPPPYVP